MEDKICSPVGKFAEQAKNLRNQKRAVTCHVFAKPRPPMISVGGNNLT